MEFDQTAAEEIIDYLIKGQSPNVAAWASGVDPLVVNQWLAWGRSGREPYKSFFEKYKISEAKAEANIVSVIIDRALEGNEKDSARAALSYLERRFPDRWGAKAKVQIEVEQAKEFLLYLEKKLPPDVMVEVWQALGNKD